MTDMEEIRAFLKGAGVFLMVITIVGCAALADMAMNQVTGGSDKGGINTELVVGDKEQVLGTNQEVKAKNIGKVTGTSDNSVSAAGAEEVTVNNFEFPVWGIVMLIALAGLVGYLAPRPQAWKRFIGSKTNEQ